MRIFLLPVNVANSEYRIIKNPTEDNLRVSENTIVQIKDDNILMSNGTLIYKIVEGEDEVIILNKASNICKFNDAGGGRDANRAENLTKRKQDEIAENPFVTIVVIKELFYYKINKIIFERIPMS